MIRAILPAAMLALAACASGGGGAEINYYLLPEPGPRTEQVDLGARTLALREIDMPLYARAAQVAHLGADGAVTLSDDHRWADEPQRAATRAVAAALRDALGVPVVVEPWDRASEPDLRIDVSLDRFIGALGGTLTLSGEFQLVSLENRQVVAAQSFSFEEPVAGDGFEALTKAHASALARLSAAIVAAIPAS